MKVLVTGHKGYIGNHLYKKLIKLGHEVRGIDLKDGEDILHCLPNERFDCVFHLAALPRVEFSMENPSYTMKQNVYVTSFLLEWAKNHGVKRFIFSSSSAIDGDGLGPKSPYGLHKLMCEMECELYSQLYNLETVCLRYYNVYSEDQEYGGAYSTAIAAWIEMIRQGKPLRMDGDGNQTRDFIHVQDVVDANIFCMQTAHKFSGSVFNVGSGKSVSMNHIKNYIDKHNMVEWVYAPQRKGDVRNTLADISQFKKHGWKPTISIQEGLKRCFKKELI